MKITWSPAVTLDGYIAKVNGDSNWVSDRDGELFEETIKESGCVIVGHTTYEQYKGQTFPIANATTYVWTQNPKSGERAEGVEFIKGTPQEVVSLLESKGYTNAVLAGGGFTNNAFVSAGLVDEITATIYPLLFGEGIKLLSDSNAHLKLKLVDSKDIGDGVIRNKYEVIRNSS